MQATLAIGPNSITDWNAINWRRTNRSVRNLRQRIFRAAQQGEWAKVRSLQRLMLRSHANRCQAVRRVTQVNQGKKTAGVDKVVVKTPTARGKLIDQLHNHQPWKAKPVKRVYIPKANGKKRPLGIPVIADRALQAIVKNALEPEWEAQFERSSYGFRPGRSTHDALGKCYLYARPNKRKKWVVDADIEGAFDNINHEFLLGTIGFFPARELIRQWLKAGYVEDATWQATKSGTPQGGVISPLLANIALHGLEQAMSLRFNTKGENISPRGVVRYADDFVVFCETQEDAQRAILELNEWLARRGLRLSADKTRIVHLTQGFDFLGLNIRHYQVSNTKTGYKLLITPSKETQAQVRQKLRQTWLSLRGRPVDLVIRTLTPIVRGQANYYRHYASSTVFRKFDDYMWVRARRYVNYRHPTKNTDWKARKYWGRFNLNRQDRWVFGDKANGAHIPKYCWFRIERHALVKGTASPDDASLREYWSKRSATKIKDLIPSDQKIAQRQHHVCPVCGDSLYNEEEIARHHIVPRNRGGKDTYGNLCFLHLYCHHQVHAGPQRHHELLCCE